MLFVIGIIMLFVTAVSARGNYNEIVNYLRNGMPRDWWLWFVPGAICISFYRDICDFIERLGGLIDRKPPPKPIYVRTRTPFFPSDQLQLDLRPPAKLVSPWETSFAEQKRIAEALEQRRRDQEIATEAAFIARMPMRYRMMYV